MRYKILAAVSVIFGALLLVGGCSNSGGGGFCPAINTSVEVCDPVTGMFTLNINNPFFPLVVGSVIELEGEEDGETITVETTVLGETRTVAGVTTRVVEEAEFEDGEVVEISLNYYAQAADGSVCYFGEEVDIYEDGEVVSHDGSWLAGEDGNMPGIIMPGTPQVGMVIPQEFAPGVAEDQAEIVAIGETVVLPAGTFSNTVSTEDCNPLDPTHLDDKVYVSGIGLAKDAEAELVEFTPGGP